MADKPIFISGHARFEMARRHIKQAEVHGVIRNPGQVVPSESGRDIYQSKIGRAKRMLLRVVVKEDADAIHVVTAYKTSKITKYWSTP